MFWGVNDFVYGLVIRSRSLILSNSNLVPGFSPEARERTLGASSSCKAYRNKVLPQHNGLRHHFDALNTLPPLSSYI